MITRIVNLVGAALALIVAIQVGVTAVDATQPGFNDRATPDQTFVVLQAVIGAAVVALLLAAAALGLRRALRPEVRSAGMQLLVAALALGLGVLWFLCVLVVGSA